MKPNFDLRGASHTWSLSDISLSGYASCHDKSKLVLAYDLDIEGPTLVLMLVIFLIAQPSPDLRCLAATTHPYAPWPSSLTNWYSESTTKVELRAVKECLCMISISLVIACQEFVHRFIYSRTERNFCTVICGSHKTLFKKGIFAAPVEVTSK